MENWIFPQNWMVIIYCPHPSLMFNTSLGSCRICLILRFLSDENKSVIFYYILCYFNWSELHFKINVEKKGKTFTDCICILSTQKHRFCYCYNCVQSKTRQDHKHTHTQNKLTNKQTNQNITISFGVLLDTKNKNQNNNNKQNHPFSLLSQLYPSFCYYTKTKED